MITEIEINRLTNKELWVEDQYGNGGNGKRLIPNNI